MLNKETVTDIATAPDGTGPFTFVEWIPGDHASYQKNPAYWNTEALAGWPDEIVSQADRRGANPDRESQGGPDRPGGELPSQLVKELEQRSERAAHPAAVYRLLLGVNFNVRQPPFDNLQVRQAVAMAIDKEAIHQNVFFGTGEVGCSLIPSTHWAYDPSITCPAARRRGGAKR